MRLQLVSAVVVIVIAFIGMSTRSDAFAVPEGRLTVRSENVSSRGARFMLGGSNTIIVRDRDGTRTPYRPSAGGAVFLAQWAPDGRAIAYAEMFRGTGLRSRLCLISLASGQQRCPTGERFGNITEISWRPDSRSVAVAGERELWTVDVETGTRKDFVSSATRARLRVGGYVGVTWSPSGRFLAAATRVERPTARDVEIVFSPAGEAVRVLPAAGALWYARWSKNDVLAYVNSSGGGPGKGVNTLETFDMRSGTHRTIETVPWGCDGSIRALAWSPSGRWLARAVWDDRSGKYGGWVVRLQDTTGREPLRRFSSGSNSAAPQIDWR